MKKFGFMKKMFQRGISLLEVMLSLSIIAVIFVMATRYYSTANESNDINTLREQVGSIVAAAMQYRSANNDSFQNVSMSVLTTNGYLPSTAATTPWAGAVTVTAGTAGGVANAMATIEIKNLPDNHVCAALCASYPTGTICSTTPIVCGSEKSFSVRVPLGAAAS